MVRTKAESEALQDAALRVFDGSPSAAYIETFNHAEAVGFVIKWSLKGVGFGELTIVKSRETGEWSVEDELTGPDTIARILAEAFPQGETTRLDLQNLGCETTSEALRRAFDEIDATGHMTGKFGSELMNALVQRYEASQRPRTPAGAA